MPANNTQRALWLSLLMVLIASTAAVATRFASARVSIEAIVSVQNLICLLLCLPITLRPGLGNLKTGRLGLHFFRGAAGVLGFYLFYGALAHIPMVDAMLLRQSAPLTVPLVAFVWSRERIAASAWGPLLIGFAGILMILRPGPEGLNWWHAGGFLSALCLSVSMVATHKLASTEPASRILLYYFLLSLAYVAPFSLSDYSGLRWQDWAAMLYVGGAMYFTLRLYTRAYAIAPAHLIAPINYLAVVLGALWGWLIWGQVPDAWSVSGSALVIVGGLLTLYLARSPASPGKIVASNDSRL